MGYSTEVISPFNGKIKRIYYNPGDDIEAGEVLISLYVNDVSMDILSPIDGKVELIDVVIGEKVISGMVIAIIKEAH
ncbi:biotin/lipoyl-containing protein [Alkalihalobacillus sp. BA299]|uniref:biotin/lipoyl-containing protein n=1 Tax=Alkalihalobacillus sp. BA299 TaxID=2815938 RepID=UPI001ADCC34C|nr:biotin/lipoyl-containing protein [Alkalihalobacillus sp. BA299]